MPTAVPHVNLEPADVTLVVQRMLGDANCEASDLSVTAVSGGSETTSSLYTVSGSAATAQGIVPWSVILKCIHPSHAPENPAAWDYRRREPLAYASGELTTLPRGLSAPQCFDVTEQPDGSIWIWLEHLAHHSDAPWTLDTYGAVAYELGRFNGAFLAGHSVPTGEWVSRDWLRHYVARYAPVMQALPTVPPEHLVRRAIPQPYLEELLHLCEDSPQWLDTLDQLPQMFCHLDAWRPNLFLNPTEDGEIQVTAVDWAFSGVAALGQELAPLLLSNRRETRLEAQALDQYLQGLTSVGWQGDANAVQLGYILAIPLAYAVGGLGYYIEALLDEAQHPILEASFGESLEKIAARFTGWLDFSLAYARRAREML